MEVFVRRFIKSSLLWLAFGVVLGTTMILSPSYIVYRPAHVHANLLGFVSMMIFGVAYHVLPRFTGNRLFSPRLAAAHVLVANAGFVLLVLGWLLMPHTPAAGWLLRTGAIASTGGVTMFILNIWKTMSPASANLHALTRKVRQTT